MNQPDPLLHPSLSYPFADTLPESGQIIEVAPGIYWIRMPLPFALNHINLWLLRDSEGWTLVDCGFSTPQTHAAWEQIFAQHLEGLPIRRIIVTHYHPDHVGLATWISERFNADIWMTEGEFLTAQLIWHSAGTYQVSGMVKLFGAHGLSAEQLATLEERGSGNGYRKGAPTVPGDFRRLMDGDILRIGAHQWEIIVGYGHAPEHASLYCDEFKVLISGDMLLPKISTNVGVWPIEPLGNPLKLFLNSLDSFTKLPIDTLVLPSHGKVFRGIHARVEQLKYHHQQRLELLLTHCRQPKTAAQLLLPLFERELDSHQLFFAMGEAIAHLNYLVEEGRLTRQPGLNQTLVFEESH